MGQAQEIEQGRRGKVQYWYFISFHYAGKQGHGFGNAESGGREIKNLEDILEITHDVENNQGLERGTVVILNYQLLRVTEEAPANG